MIRTIALTIVVALRKARRALGLPVLDLSGDVGPFKRDVRAMEGPQKTDQPQPPPKE